MPTAKLLSLLLVCLVAIGAVFLPVAATGADAAYSIAAAPAGSLAPARFTSSRSSATVAGGDCWGCERTEDYRWNWVEEEWQMMPVSACWPGYGSGYAYQCWEELNDFEWPSGEYVGGDCEMWEDPGSGPCTCSKRFPQWPFGCPPIEMPLQQVAADGFLVSAAVLFDSPLAEEEAVTCKGLKLERRIGIGAVTETRAALRGFLL